MNPINNIGGVGGVNSTNSTSATSQIAPTTSTNSTSVRSTRVGGASFDESFQFPPQLEKEIAFKYGSSTESVVEELIMIFHKLLRVILKYKIIIRSSPMKERGGAIIEARLRQDIRGKKRPIIEAPIPGVTEDLDIMYTNEKKISLQDLIKNYLDSMLPFITNGSLIRLIVVIAHEFGHYLSFLMGYHTKPLHEALRIYASGRVNSYYVDQFLYLVFNEEISAWSLAEKTLKNNCGFQDMSIFNSVKEQSLKTYIKMLSLDSANKLNTYYRLGENYVKLNRSLRGK